ncbi:MAG: permease-like cell division protein FtsX [Vicinamibacterales bacterium]
MKTLSYACREAWLSLWRSRASGSLAVAAIALAMLVLGALLVVTSNLERIMAHWTTASEFSVYLRDDATSEQRGAIEAVIDGSGVAAGRDYVSKAEALARFRREFADLATVASSVEDNPFPASIEVRVKVEAEREGRADPIVQRIGGLPGVADVQYDREWLIRLAAGLTAVRRAGLAMAMLMALAAAVTVSSVVRLGLYNRRDELEVMQLVGSPLSFLRGPFVAEGVMQGGLGALLAIIALWMGFRVASGWWGSDLAVLLDGESVRFLPLSLCAALLGGGMVVGAAGGFAASRHAV